MDKIKWNESKKEESKKTRFLDKELHVAFKLDPKKAAKVLACVVIFLVIFGLGRWSASCPGCVEETETVPEEDSSSEGFFSMLTGLFHADEEVPETEPVEEAVEEVEEVVEEVVEEEVVEEEPEPEPEPEPEAIITNYKKVSFAISSVTVDWKGTEDNKWGKITKLQFTIKNEEDGTILPDYFSMMVEGYPDEASKVKVPLPSGSMEIKSKTSATSEAIVPGGFNYNEKTTGALDDVEIRFILFDDDSKPMASYRKVFNLDRS